MLPLRAVVGLAALGLVFGSASAEAKKKRTLMVLPLEAEGVERAAEAEAVIRKALRKGLSRYRMLPASKLNFSAMQVATGCGEDQGNCLAVIGQTLGASQVIRVALTEQGGQARFALVRLAVRGKKLSSYDAEMPWDAGFVELRYHVMKAVGADPGRAVGSLAPYLASKLGSLEGAEYSLNGQEVPLTALSQVQPGPHRLEVNVAGFEPFTWSGKVEAFKPTRVAVRFDPAAQQTPAIATGSSNSGTKSSSNPPVAPSSAAVSGDPVTQVESDLQEDDEGLPYIATYALGGATLVAGGVTVFLLTRYQGALSDAEDAGIGCDPADNWDPNTPICQEGRSKARNLNIGIGVTAALAGATVTALIIEMLLDDDASAPVAVSVGPSAVHVSGRF